MKNIDLKLLFKSLQDQMVVQLNTNREFIEHPGSKGDALENAWIEWLQKYLPNRYSVDKAIVIDHQGNTSDQIDVVIYDNWYTPFVFSQNGFHYIPAEGVYAVLEVKPDIKGCVKDQTYIEYAAAKIESVRCLKRTSTGMINSGVKTPARALTKIVGGILASTNSYTHCNTKSIEGHLRKQKGLRGIDIGCIADYGSFYVDYDGQEDTSLKETSVFSKRYTDYYEGRSIRGVTFSAPENSLVSFFLQLTRYLQQAIGTVPAIDLNAYSQAIDFEIADEL